jgi:DNA helicase-2/ATP-dependent DNA helicase PcrA
MLELDDRQLAAATSPAEQVFISAGPGAGKTRILAARASHLVASGVDGRRITALTYTRSMASDLRARIASAMPDLVRCQACDGTGELTGFTCGACLGNGGSRPTQPVVGTLHSLAAGWVRRALKGDLAGAGHVLALRWVQTPDFGIAQPEDVDDLVEVAYQELRKRVTKRVLRAGLKAHGADLERFTEKTEARRQLAIRGLVTFSDLLVMLMRVVSAPALPGGPPRLADEIPQMIVDEGQDLSPMHWAIIDAWGPTGLTVAGDDAQAIYSFMHDETRADFPGVPLFQQRLAAARARLDVGRNYRSVRSIVTDCRRVRRQLTDDGACSDLDLQPIRPDEPGSVVIEADEPGGGASFHVQGLLEGGAHPAAGQRAFRPEEIAVLARTWEELEAVGAELKELGIPFAIPERGRDRWRSHAGRAVVAMARSADRGFIDEMDARTVLRVLGHADPARIVRDAMFAATQERKSLARALDHHPAARAGLPAGWWPNILEKKITSMLAAHIEEADVLGGRPLVEAAREMTTWQPVSRTGEEDDPAPATPGDWLCWLASDESNCNVQMREGHVVLTTIHGAKGLEWPAVVLVGASEGSLPSPGRMDTTDEDVAEAGRILYVGMTRARDVLRVICPSNIRGKPRSPSRWLVRARLIESPARAG